MAQGPLDEREAFGADVGEFGYSRRRADGQGGRLAPVEAGEAEGDHDPDGIGLPAEPDERSLEGILSRILSVFAPANDCPGPFGTDA